LTHKGNFTKVLLGKASSYQTFHSKRKWAVICTVHFA
jgi:hypothetical protein